MARIEPMTVWEPTRSHVAIARGTASHTADEIELDLSYQQAHSLFLELGSFLMSRRSPDRVAEAMEVLDMYHDTTRTAEANISFQRWIADPENVDAAALREHYADGRNWPTSFSRAV